MSKNRPARDPLAVTCPQCHRGPGEPCITLRDYGIRAYGALSTRPTKQPHPARYQAAKRAEREQLIGGVQLDIFGAIAETEDVPPY